MNDIADFNARILVSDDQPVNGKGITTLLARVGPDPVEGSCAWSTV